MKHESYVQIKLNSNKLVVTLSIMALFLFIGSIAGQLIRYILPFAAPDNLINEFYVDSENNIQTFFSSVILIITSLLFGLIYLHERKSGFAYRLPWLVFAAVFLFLAIDESTLIYHQLLSTYLSAFFAFMLGNVFRISVGTLFLLPFLFLAFKFYMHLPIRYRVLFALSALLYAGGAIGMDFIGTQYHEVHGKYNLPYSMLATLEKMVETAGLIFCIYTSSKYLSGLTEPSAPQEAGGEPLSAANSGIDETCGQNSKIEGY